VAALQHLRRQLFIDRRRCRLNLRTRLERRRLHASRRRDGFEQERIGVIRVRGVRRRGARPGTGAQPSADSAADDDAYDHHTYDDHDHDHNTHDDLDDAQRAGGQRRPLVFVGECVEQADSGESSDLSE
jgi:hypothetical protein